MREKNTNESYCFFSDGCNIFWQMGFAKYMQAKEIYSKKAVFTGFQSGLLTALALAVDFDLKTVCKMISKYNSKNHEEIVQIIYKEEDINMIEELTKDIIEETADAYKRCNKKLFVPIQAVNGSIHFISEFSSNINLLNVIKASIFNSLINVEFLKVNKDLVLPIAPLKKYPLINPYTIIISCRDSLKKYKFEVLGNPFDSLEIVKAKVSPQLQMSYRIPMISKMKVKIYKNGYHDAKEYFLNN